MAIKKEVYECENCAFPYETLEQAEICETYCKVFNPVNQLINSSYNSRHHKAIDEVHTFLELFQKQNGFKVNPFEIESTKLGGLIKFLPNIKTTEIKEQVIWGHIYTIFESGTLFKTSSGLEVPIAYLESIIDSFIKSFKKNNPEKEVVKEKKVKVKK